ncbi:putative outer membrane domain protein [Vibrio parahaemolyticus VP-48]|nr:putative outer membrane domain protein [Vibrio parahaemolyticus VP-48]
MQDRTDWDGYLDEENRTLPPLPIETPTENGDKNKTEDL